MPLDTFTNFAYGTLASGITAGATSATLSTGHGARFPSTAFNAVIWDTNYASPNSAYHSGAAEIVRVTARSTDTLTITRAQEGTSAVAFNTSGRTYAVGQTFTNKTLEEIAPLAGPTFTGTATVENLVITKGVTIAPAPMAALEIDVTEMRNTVSIAVNSTLTFSATPATGATFGVTITETSGIARDVTFPEGFSQNVGVPITVFTVPANGIVDVSWERTATGYKIFGDPLTIAQQKAILDVQIVDVYGLQSALDAKAATTHAHSAADVTSGVLTVERGGTGTAAPALIQGTNVTITGTWPNQTINATGGGGSGSGESIVLSGGSASTSFTFLETISAGSASTDHTNLFHYHGGVANTTY